jgi:hypothetical protein
MQFGRKLGYCSNKDAIVPVSVRVYLFSHKAPCYVEWIQAEAERRL